LRANIYEPASRRSGDKLEVSGLAPDDRAKRDNRLVTSCPSDTTAHRRELKRPRRPIHIHPIGRDSVRRKSFHATLNQTVYDVLIEPSRNQSEATSRIGAVSLMV
jgi:hypothetical protein